MSFKPQAILKSTDFEWGGRVRPQWHKAVRNIVEKVAAPPTREVRGNMLRSQETYIWRFLDGELSVTYGGRGGMFLYGWKARAYVLWQLGGDPNVVFPGGPYPSLEALALELEDVTPG